MCWNAKRPVLANMEFGDLCILCAAHTIYLLRQYIRPPPQRLGGVGLIVGNYCTGVERLAAAGSLPPSLEQLPIPLKLCSNVTLLAVALLVPEGVMQSPRIRHWPVYRALTSS